MKERFTLVLCASVQWDELKRCITSMLMRRTGFLEIWILGGLVNRGRSWRGGERRKRYAELNCPCDGAPLSHNGAITLALTPSVDGENGNCPRLLAVPSPPPPAAAFPPRWAHFSSGKFAWSAVAALQKRRLSSPSPSPSICTRIQAPLRVPKARM